MRLLVVEGNKKETWQEREARGGVAYHKRFRAMLRILQPEAAVEVVFPADEGSFLPSIEELKTFDGVLWTGSSLYIQDQSPAVLRQLDFADDVFESGVPFYGSCWGLQIASVVAGGEVGPNPKGREIGITQPIKLTEAGLKHPCFRGRKDKFHALCVHLDEVIKLPANSVVLAGNEHSAVQALAFRYKNSEFFGVQYHPEFLVSDMVFIIRFLSELFISEGLFESQELVETLASKLENQSSLPECVANYLLHTQEVKYWLDGLNR
ncbi:MAG: type 1 glutamine amidotransferase [Bacteroidia bacterium]